MGLCNRQARRRFQMRSSLANLDRICFCPKVCRMAHEYSVHFLYLDRGVVILYSVQTVPTSFIDVFVHFAHFAYFFVENPKVYKCLLCATNLMFFALFCAILWHTFASENINPRRENGKIIVSKSRFLCVQNGRFSGFLKSDRFWVICRLEMIKNTRSFSERVFA